MATALDTQNHIEVTSYLDTKLTATDTIDENVASAGMYSIKWTVRRGFTFGCGLRSLRRNRRLCYDLIENQIQIKGEGSQR